VLPPGTSSWRRRPRDRHAMMSPRSVAARAITSAPSKTIPTPSTPATAGSVARAMPPTSRPVPNMAWAIRVRWLTFGGIGGPDRSRGRGVAVPTAVGGRRAGGRSWPRSSGIRTGSGSSSGVAKGGGFLMPEVTRKVEGQPNGSRLSCGRRARGRKEVELQTKRLAGEPTQVFLTCERPPASSAC